MLSSPSHTSRIPASQTLRLKLKNEQFPPQFAQLLAQMISPSNDADQKDTPENSSDEAEEMSNFIARNLLFRHGTESGRA